MSEWTIAPAQESVVAPVTVTALSLQQPLYLPREQVIRTPKCGARGQFAATNATLYTAPSGTSPTGNTQGAILKSIVLCNTDSSSRTVTIYVVESGGTAAANRAILSAASIAANTTVTLTFPDDTFPLDSGETVQGLASSANLVTYRINVVELTN